MLLSEAKEILKKNGFILEEHSDLTDYQADVFGWLGDEVAEDIENDAETIRFIENCFNDGLSAQYCAKCILKNY